MVNLTIGNDGAVQIDQPSKSSCWGSLQSWCGIATPSAKTLVTAFGWLDLAKDGIAAFGTPLSGVSQSLLRFTNVNAGFEAYNKLPKALEACKSATTSAKNGVEAVKETTGFFGSATEFIGQGMQALGFVWDQATLFVFKSASKVFKCVSSLFEAIKGIMTLRGLKDPAEVKENRIVSKENMQAEYKSSKLSTIAEIFKGFSGFIYHGVVGASLICSITFASVIPLAIGTVFLVASIAAHILKNSADEQKEIKTAQALQKKIEYLEENQSKELLKKAVAS